MYIPTLFLTTIGHGVQGASEFKQELLSAFDFLFNEEYWYAVISLDEYQLKPFSTRKLKLEEFVSVTPELISEIQSLQEPLLRKVTIKILLNLLQLEKIISTIQLPETKPFSALVRNKPSFFFNDAFPLRVDLSVMNVSEAVMFLDVLISNLPRIVMINSDYEAVQVTESITEEYASFFIANHKKSLNYWLNLLAEDIDTAISEFAIGSIVSAQGTFAHRTAELIKKSMNIGSFREETIRGVDVFLRTIIPLFSISQRVSDPLFRVYLKWYLGEEYCSMLRILNDVKIPADFDPEKAWKSLAFLEEHVDANIRKLFSALRFILSRRRISGLINGLRIQLDFVGDILRVHDVLQIINIAIENIRWIREGFEEEMK